MKYIVAAVAFLSLILVGVGIFAGSNDLILKGLVTGYLNTWLAAVFKQIKK